MADTHNRFQETFNDLFALPLQDKTSFLELFLFSFTISARGIWSDGQSTDAEKVEAFKWLNELNHRIWNIRSELKKGLDNDSINRLYENLKFYGEQSALLGQHLAPTLLSAFERFKDIRRTA